MLKLLIELDYYLFKTINAWNSSIADDIMFVFSHRFVWIPLYLYIIYLIFKQYNKTALVIIISLVATLVLTDQISVLTKEFFMRLRPSHNPAFESFIHINKGIKGGLYGFVSSHAANVAGFISFLYFIKFFKNKYLFTFLLIWAFLVSYSRIYNGLHYPLDILGGWVVGIFIGFCTSYAIKILYLKKNY
jgi:undecaprenyl-diphosphatase